MSSSGVHRKGFNDQGTQLQPVTIMENQMPRIITGRFISIQNFFAYEKDKRIAENDKIQKKQII